MCHLLAAIENEQLGLLIWLFKMQLNLDQTLTNTALVGWLSGDAQIPWADEHNIKRSVFLLCSVAHIILENQLTVACLALDQTQIPLYCFFAHSGARFKKAWYHSWFHTNALHITDRVNIMNLKYFITLK